MGWFARRGSLLLAATAIACTPRPMVVVRQESAPPPPPRSELDGYTPVGERTFTATARTTGRDVFEHDTNGNECFRFVTFAVSGGHPGDALQMCAFYRHFEDQHDVCSMFLDYLPEGRVTSEVCVLRPQRLRVHVTGMQDQAEGVEMGVRGYARPMTQEEIDALSSRLAAAEENNRIRVLMRDSGATAPTCDDCRRRLRACRRRDARAANQRADCDADWRHCTSELRGRRRCVP